MFGFILALLYAAWVVIFGDSAPELAYLKSANFLFWWYMVWTIILGAFVGLFALVAMLGGAAAGASEGGKIGAAVGMVLGGGFSGLIVFFFAIRRAMYVGGAYLLSMAVTHGSPWEWHIPHLLLGGLLLLVAFVTGRRARASSSHSR